MPQIVEADPAQAGAFERRVKAPLQQVGVTRGLPVEIREHEIVRTLGTAQPPRLQLIQQKRRQGQSPVRGAGLGLLEPAFFEGAADVKLTALEVNVAPRGAEDFAHPDPVNTANEMSSR